MTVTGESLLWADVYATAAVARGDVAWLDGVRGYEAMLLDGDGMTHTTTGWRPSRRPGSTNR